jgi:carbonic anhydrase/acetyltransferase-like protein (isoleucine patch superfamily)
VGVGAIVLIEADSGVRVDRPFRSCPGDTSASQTFTEEPLAFVDLFGRSLLERTVEHFTGAGVEVTSVIAHTDVFSEIAVQHRLDNFNIQAADEVWFQVARVLQKYSENGIHYAFIAKPSAYIEADLVDLLDFHRKAHAAVTRASDSMGPLDLWIVDCDAMWQSGKFAGIATSELSVFPSSYFVGEYVKRITHPRDFRQLVLDSFLARCRMHPAGKEVRPGVWAEEGAQVHRGARIVAPAYLGSGSIIQENALITRFSNIESSSYIDYGTAIEDATVLPNTYVGISLDVRHAVVHGNKLLNLKHDVIIETSDASLFQSNSPAGMEVKEKSTAMGLPDGAGAKDWRDEQRQNCFAKSISSVNPTTEFES